MKTLIFVLLFGQFIFGQDMSKDSTALKQTNLDLMQAINMYEKIKIQYFQLETLIGYLEARKKKEIQILDSIKVK